MLLQNILNLSVGKALPWMLSISLLATGASVFATHTHSTSPTNWNDDQFNGFVTASPVALPSPYDDYNPVAGIVAFYTGLSATIPDEIVLANNETDSVIVIYPGDGSATLTIPISSMSATSIVTGPFYRLHNTLDHLSIAVAGACTTGPNSGEGMIVVIPSYYYGYPTFPIVDTIYNDEVASFNGMATGPFNLDNPVADNETFFYSLALTGVDFYSEDGYVYIYDGFGDNTFGYGDDYAGYAERYQVGTDPRGIAIAQLTNNRGSGSNFNGYWEYDLVVANSSSNIVSVLYGNGDNTFTPAASFNTADSGNPYNVAVGRFNWPNPDYPPISTNQVGQGYQILDGLKSWQDFAVVCVDDPSTPENSVDLFINSRPVSGTPTFITPSAIGLNSSQTGGTTYPSIALGYLSNTYAGDDIVVTSNNGILLLANQGNNHFILDPTFYPTGSNPSALAVADLNNDGYLDVFVTNQDDSTVTTLYQNLIAPQMVARSGKVQFGVQTTYTVYLGWKNQATYIGGQPVTYYIVSCPGLEPQTIQVSSFGNWAKTNFTGLAPGVYTFTLVAYTTVGSSASAPSTVTITVGD